MNPTQTEVEQLRSQLDEAKASIERYASKCICVFCRTEFLKTDVEGLTNHILSCDKSPLVQLVAQAKTLNEQLVAELKAQIEINEKLEKALTSSEAAVEHKEKVLRLSEEKRDEIHAALAVEKAEREKWEAGCRGNADALKDVLRISDERRLESINFRTALEFYAVRKNWQAPNQMDADLTPTTQDGGKLARIAIGLE